MKALALVFVLVLVAIPVAAQGTLSVSYTAAQQAGVNMKITRCGSMLTCFFTDGDAPQNYDQATQCDTDAFARFFNAMLERGVVLPPSQFETWFVSTVHDARMIEQTVEAAGDAFGVIARGR